MYRVTYDVTSAMNISNGSRKHCCLDLTDHARLRIVTAYDLEIHLRTYLLTYLEKRLATIPVTGDAIGRASNLR